MPLKAVFIETGEECVLPQGLLNRRGVEKIVIRPQPRRR